MQANTGDHIVIKGHRVGEPDRQCEVLEARGVGRWLAVLRALGRRQRGADLPRLRRDGRPDDPPQAPLQLTPHRGGRWVSGGADPDAVISAARRDADERDDRARSR